MSIHPPPNIRLEVNFLTGNKLKHKYKHWGILNELGREQFGHIFPVGIVPLKILIPENATLEGQMGVHRIYKVDIDLLTEEQYNQITKLISECAGVPFDDVKSDFEKDGFIPMTSKYISTSGTDQLHRFL